MFNFLNAQREENLANQHSSSSSSSSSSPLSPPRPTASQKQTPAQTQDQLRDPSQLVTQLSALLAKKNKTNQKATLKSVQRRVDRRDGPSGICKKTGQLFAAIIEQLNARLAEETGFQNMVTIEGVLGHMPDGLDCFRMWTRTHTRPSWLRGLRRWSQVQKGQRKGPSSVFLPSRLHRANFPLPR
jgi:hypothetical protein